MGKWNDKTVCTQGGEDCALAEVFARQLRVGNTASDWLCTSSRDAHNPKSGAAESGRLLRTPPTAIGQCETVSDAPKLTLQRPLVLNNERC